MKDTDYKMPEIEEIKRLSNEFFKEADKFIARQKEYNRKRGDLYDKGTKL